MQNGMFKLANMTTTFAGSGFAATRVRPYPQNKEGEISIAIREAWQWLIFNFLIMPADGTTDGWLFARKVFPKPCFARRLQIRSGLMLPDATLRMPCS